MTEVATKSDLELTRRMLETVVQNSELRLENRMDRLELGQERLKNSFEGLELRLLVRLGGLIAIGIAVLAAIIKF